MRLVEFVDDCWEPSEAVATLRKLAGSRAGSPFCLRIAGDDTRMIPPDEDGDASEKPGTAAYLWVLWSGSPPTREQLLVVYREHRAASDGSSD